MSEGGCLHWPARARVGYGMEVEPFRNEVGGKVSAGRNRRPNFEQRYSYFVFSD